ncbi:phage tail tape measure protein [Bacillus timonensis]|uniref:Phage tail tape measure protein n=1 Tax=Bacillus timonensis TaxID=1033734 RepID=A0A4S3PKG7_9BACI|nr:phage tail tape measure protein [Bacillus timonensis]THE09951.1 phage tail tape measure protein [Bacillus timonensis]
MSTDLGDLRARLLLEAQQFKKGMNEAREEMKKTGKEAKDTNKGFDGLHKALKDVGLSSSQIDKITEKIKKTNPKLLEKDFSEVRDELKKLGLDSKEIDKLTKEVEKASKSTHNLEEDLNRIQTASLAIGAAMVAGIGLSVKTAADFEQQMSRVKAISGATSEEFKRLQASALDLGASTSKSASEVALGMEDMAAMGFNVNEIIAAMPGVISASEAAGSDLATTAGIVAAALNSFQLEASEATRVADVLAMAANVSAASVDDMGYAFKYAAPIANSLGISMEEVAAAIGIMTNSGLEGSQAGTSLRQIILLSLNNPAKEQEKLMKKLGFSIKDSSGNAKTLSQMIKDLTKSTEGMTKADKLATIAKLVGTEAASGMIAIIDGGVDRLDEFTEALRNSEGASKEAADVMMDNLKGAYEEFTGALETAGIKLGNEFLPLFTEVVRHGAKVIETITEMDSSTVKSGLAFAGTATAIALTITTLSKLAIAVRGLMVSMGPAGWLIAGLSIIGGLIAGVTTEMAAAREVDLEAILAKKDLSDTLASNIEEYEQLQLRNKLSNDELARFVDINSEISKTTDPEIITRLKDEQAKLQKESGLSADELQRLVDLNDEIIEVVPDATVEITKQGNALLDNVDAAKDFNKELAESLKQQIELDMQATSTEYRDALKEEKQLILSINKLNEDKEAQLKNVEELQIKVNEVRREYNEMQRNSDKYSEKMIADKGMELTLLEKDLDYAGRKVDKLAEEVKTKQSSLDKTHETIKGQEDLLNQLIDIELKQAGINAKKGEGLRTVEQEIIKLQFQKSNMEKNTNEAYKSTEEYKEGIKAIDQQISNLETVRDRVKNIISEAGLLNSELGRSVNKNVTITTSGGRNAMALLRHQGGPAIPGLMDYLPKFHNGGSPSFLEMFKNAPMHNEIDARLLQNELVLTEAQQANLFRMIDEGFTSNSGNSESFNLEVIRLLREIERGIARGFNATIIMDERTVGQVIEPHVTEQQRNNEAKESRAEGD